VLNNHERQSACIEKEFLIPNSCEALSMSEMTRGQCIARVLLPAKLQEIFSPLRLVRVIDELSFP